MFANSGDTGDAEGDRDGDNCDGDSDGCGDGDCDGGASNDARIGDSSSVAAENADDADPGCTGDGASGGVSRAGHLWSRTMGGEGGGGVGGAGGVFPEKPGDDGGGVGDGVAMSHGLASMSCVKFKQAPVLLILLSTRRTICCSKSEKVGRECEHKCNILL